MKTLSIIGQKAHQKLAKFWHRSLWHKSLSLLLATLIFLVAMMFAVSQWYAWSQRNKPVEWGVSFIPAYAESLGLDAQETMDALLGIGVKNFRLVSYWNQLETAPGQYDFSLLDWQFQKAEAHDAKITLTLGLRQPRWPECHPPAWVDTAKPSSQWQPQLEKFITATVERYKRSPALKDYQLENEFFLKGFGDCKNFERSRLVSEYNLLKRLDPQRPVVIGRSNNALGFPVGKPTPEEFGISVYKRVWDAGVTKRYLEYPQPDWFYGYIAGVQKLIWNRDMRIAELQAEAWPPRGQEITQASLAEQNKSLDAQRLRDRFSYGRGTGMKLIDLWGVEYWYYRLRVLGDPSLWDVAKTEFDETKH